MDNCIQLFYLRYIGGNPFDCTCDLEPFTVLMKRKKMLPYNSWAEEPKCNSPSHLNGEQIIDVPFHNMSCSTQYGKYNAKSCHL